MIRVVAETGSTNADMAVLARDGAEEGLWLRAGRQTGGRGRLGRRWNSAPGNLHASTLVRLGAGDPPAPGLALVAGVALQAAAAGAGATDARLKWPNDLLAGGAKLAGILLEREGDAVVVGIGVNLAHHPDGLDRETTDLAVLTGTAPDPDAFLAGLASCFARWLRRWRAEGLGPVRERWLEVAHPLGSALAVTGGAARLVGHFDGLAADGSLRLRLAGGRVELVRAGDVALI